jgi:hypothetical protein
MLTYRYIKVCWHTGTLRYVDIPVHYGTLTYRYIKVCWHTGTLLLLPFALQKGLMTDGSIRSMLTNPSQKNIKLYLGWWFVLFSSVDMWNHITAMAVLQPSVSGDKNICARFGCKFYLASDTRCGRHGEDTRTTLRAPKIADVDNETSKLSRITY